MITVFFKEYFDVKLLRTVLFSVGQAVLLSNYYFLDKKENEGLIHIRAIRKGNFIRIISFIILCGFSNTRQRCQANYEVVKN